METLYFWLFIFAGATLMVLGIILVASERELGKQRRELEKIRHNSETQPSSELVTRNKELLETISSVSAQLEESKRTVEELQCGQSALVSTGELDRELQTSQETIKKLETEQQRLGGVNLENQQLREEITTLRNQFQTSETRLSESACQNQEITERCAQLQNEVVELRQRLEEGQARLSALEGVQEQLTTVASREMMLRDQQDQLKGQIVELQRELDTRKEKAQELDTTHKQLAETEHVCQELRQENRRLDEEISLWRERAAESEETQSQVSTLRQQLAELQAKQAAAVAEANSLNDGNDEKRGNRFDSCDSEARIHAANDEENKPFTQAPGKRTRRFGMIAATGAIAIVATVAVGVLNTNSNGPSGSKEPAVAPEIVSIEQSIPIEAGPETLKRSSPPAGANESPKQIRKRVQGTYRITRSTQVYSEPSDTSELIANIKPGIKINVVDSRNGWLEIRSKHGRPPGFVRQTAAVRINQN
jgi:uncharacterized coiled-coil DUF342 family protein